jgi:hypothetical protein
MAIKIEASQPIYKVIKRENVMAKPVTASNCIDIYRPTRKAVFGLIAMSYGKI